MRITGGSLRGRTLKAPAGLGTRPTTDRVREALFGILAHHDWGYGERDFFQDRVVLDAFAGTGALGLESLSRGAAQCFFFEKDRSAYKNVSENIRNLELEDRSKAIQCDVLHPGKGSVPCSLVFFDPPYNKALIPNAFQALEKAGWLAPDVFIVAETSRNEKVDLPASCSCLLTRVYGDTALHFFGCK